MKQKRYQYYSKDGIQQSEWFNCFEDEEEVQFQFGKKLLNEYRTI